MSLVTLSLLLDKINNADKDHRYMATSDLARELQSSQLVLDDSESKRVLSAVLSQLNDVSGDISGLANTCLATLAVKFEGIYVEEMCKALLNQMTSDKSEVKRDVAYLGLKTVIHNLRMQEMQGRDQVAQSMGVWLMECMKSDTEEIASNGYDLLLLYVNTHGAYFPNRTEVAEFCVMEFDNPRPGIRKKAMQCLGKIVGSLPVDVFHRICSTMLGNIQKCLNVGNLSGSDLQHAHTLVMAMAFIERGSGYRMEPHIVELNTMCLTLASMALQDEDGVDLAEACLVVLELGMSNCPTVSSKQMSAITDVAMLGISYDPNYAADSDMDTMSDGGSMADRGASDYDEEDSEDDDGFSDDDDSSWKVRRAACKVIAVQIKEYKSEIEFLYDACYRKVFKRVVSEREEIVRQDVFSVYMDMLHVIGEKKESSLYTKLYQNFETAIYTLTRSLRKQPQKIKVCTYQTLEIIVRMERDLFSVALSLCSSDVIDCLRDDSFSSLQVQMLKFLEAGFETSDNKVPVKDFVAVADEVFNCTQRKHFALAALAIRVCQSMVHLIRPNPLEPISPDAACLVLPFFITISDSLSGSEKPQEVKNAAIDCIGDAVGRMGDLLEGTQVEALAKDFAAMPSNAKRAKIQGSSESNTGHLPRLEDVVSLLIERLSNETTRLACLRALKKIIESPLHLDIGDALGDATSSIKSYLRKLDRQTRITSVETLSVIIKYKAADWTPLEVNNLIDDVSGFISDDDLGVSNSMISLLENLVVIQPDVASTLLEKTLASMQELLSSPTLQASSLESLQILLKTVMTRMKSNHRDVMQTFVDFGFHSGSKQVKIAAAKCVSTLASCFDDSSSFLSSQFSSLLTFATPEKIFLLYCIKEVGAAKLGMEDEHSLREAVVSCMDEESCSEAAACALGGLAAGRDSSHLGFMREVLSQSGDKKSQYHMLRALVEALKIISTSNDLISSEIQEEIEKVVAILIHLNLDDNNNEEIESIIAQCYGLASRIYPNAVLPSFETQLSAQDPRCRIMALSGMKSGIVEAQQPTDNEFRTKLIPEAMKRLSDQDVSVRRSATLLLGFAAHNKISLVRDMLPSFIPALIEQTKPDPDLIRVVNLGPFKHKIDDGLEQRKSAFDCLGILISKCWDTLPDHMSIAKAIVWGLADQYEVKLKCHDLIISVTHLNPNLMLSVLDQVIEPFTKTLTARLKADAVRQEVDRNEDMLRSCLRAIDTLDKIEGSEGVLEFKTFLQNVVYSDTVAPKYNAIVKERKQSECM